MPTLAPAERWGPQVGNPGMPHRPALSVKLQPSTSVDLATIITESGGMAIDRYASPLVAYKYSL